MDKRWIVNGSYVLLISITGQVVAVRREEGKHIEPKTEWPQVVEMLGQDAVSTATVTRTQLHFDGKDWLI